MKKNILIAAVALILSFFIDIYVIKFFNLIQIDFISKFFWLISIIGSIFGVLIFMTVFLYATKRKKELYPLWMTLFIVAVLCYFLKMFIARPRPVEHILSWIDLAKYSMPSAHAAAVFSVIPFFKKKARKYWIWFAILVAFSRLYTSAHYLSDVIAGALIGYLIVNLVLKYYKK